MCVAQGSHTGSSSPRHVILVLLNFLPIAWTGEANHKQVCSTLSATLRIDGRSTNYIWIRKRDGCSGCAKYQRTVAVLFIPLLLCDNTPLHRYTRQLRRRQRRCWPSNDGIVLRRRFRQHLREKYGVRISVGCGRNVFSKNVISRSTK